MDKLGYKNRRTWCGSRDSGWETFVSGRRRLRMSCLVSWALRCILGTVSRQQLNFGGPVPNTSDPRVTLPCVTRLSRSRDWVISRQQWNFGVPVPNTSDPKVTPRCVTRLARSREWVLSRQQWKFGVRVPTTSRHLYTSDAADELTCTVPRCLYTVLTLQLPTICRTC